MKRTIIPKFAIELIARRQSLHKNIQANFGITATSSRKSRRDFLGRPCPTGRADFANAKSGIKLLGVVVFVLIQIFALNVFAQTQQADDWKNAYFIAWRGTPADNITYAKQMGYDYVCIRTGSKLTDYKNNPNCAGMKFYIDDPYYYPSVYSTFPKYDANGKAIFYPRNIDVTPVTGFNYTQAQKDWYSKRMTWKDTTSAWPYQFAFGGSTGTNTKFQATWDFQQQAVINEVVNGIMSLFASYEVPSLPFTFAGYIIDVPKLTGTFYTPQPNSKATTLAYWTGIDSGAPHIGLDGTTNKQYATYSDGLAAFYKQLNARMKQQWPNAKWMLEPGRLYNVYNASQSWTIDEYVWQVSKRLDKDLLTPDLLLEEGPTTDFVDDSRNFNSGMVITKSMVGCTQHSDISEVTDRLIAAKAGINGAWYNWSMVFGSFRTMPDFQSITQVYPRLKLGRCIANWDNLNTVPLSSRSWNGAVYQSANSYISSDVMYSRHPKTGELFSVFITTNGVVKLNPGETVASAYRVDNYFIEDTAQGNRQNIDFTITNMPNGNEIRLKSTVTIPVDSQNLNVTLTPQVMGVGYIFTIVQSPPPDTTKPIINITSPTAAATYATSQPTINLSGSASDNRGVALVTWATDKGLSGTATYNNVSSAWSINAIGLSQGPNVITVTAKDAAGNTEIDILTVAYTPVDTTAPLVTITLPTSNAAYTTANSTLGIGGTASDGISGSGVAKVEWSKNGSAYTLAAGTTSWSVSGISLVSGNNVITVRATDKAGNTAADTITVTYNSLTLAPVVTTGSATNITQTSATLNASINPNGLSITMWFEYGTISGSYSMQSQKHGITGSGLKGVAIAISGLVKATTYYYRFVGSNAKGIRYGLQKSFTTQN